MKDGKIQLAHGSGGKMSHDLIEQVMVPAFSNEILAEMHDAAAVTIGGTRLAFTTDSYVVKPLFFSGGDIGKLAVCGTVNDLAMSGAKPLYLSAGFVIEEGFPIADLQRVTDSMRKAAEEAGVFIVTGDTKVVERGAVDGLFINTAGVGEKLTETNISASRARVGQDIILSGFLGDHAIAVMSERHGLVLPAAIASDCAPLGGLVQEMLAAVPQIAVLRDPTRGGLATTLNEIAKQANVGIILEEEKIPVRQEVQAVCKILGFDPLYLANEGKMVVFVEHEYTERLLAVMRLHSYGREAKIIGKVTDQPVGQVGMRTLIGGIRLLDMLTGDQLPRIC